MKAIDMDGRTPDGKFAKGNKPVCGFGQRPQDRHHGAWKKEDTPRYWLEMMMKMQESELEAIYNDEAQPLFRRKLSKCIKDGDWTEIKEMIQEVYGKMPVTSVTVEADDKSAEEVNKFIRGFALP